MKLNNNTQYHLDVLESSTHAQSTKYEKNTIIGTYFLPTQKVYFHFVQFLNIIDNNLKKIVYLLNENTLRTII